jgi:hypothetical protein
MDISPSERLAVVMPAAKRFPRGERRKCVRLDQADLTRRAASGMLSDCSHIGPRRIAFCRRG